MEYQLDFYHLIFKYSITHQFSIMGFQDVTLGFGDNHLDERDGFHILKLAFKRLRIHGVWVPISEVLWKYNKFLNDTTPVFSDDDLDLYDDIEVIDGVYNPAKMTLEELWDCVCQFKGTNIKTQGGCFKGLVISSCGSDDDEVIDPNAVEICTKLYARLVIEGRIPSGLKLKMVANCCS